MFDRIIRGYLLLAGTLMTIKKYLPILLLFIIVFGCSKSSYITLNFSEITTYGESNEVIYYIGSNDKTTNKKVLLYIAGTGRYHASQDFGVGAEASVYSYSIVYPQKSFIEDEQLYFKTNNREQRLHDINAVIDDLVRNGTQEILIMAASEGTMLAPEIAAKRGGLISGLICLGGSVNTFENDLLFTIENKIGRYEQWGVLTVENLVKSVDDIFNNPDSTNEDFIGHSYRFWSSFLRYDAFEDLLDITVPVIYINGEFDELNLELHKEKIEQLKSKGVDIVSVVYQGVGHVLSDMGKKLSEDIFEWAAHHNIIK